ncbi:carboxypeptidase-like regulatory domain-containing protein, partial [Flavihumibacter sediminis]|nr:carboxypeptidase-like regulatory domain-containing protein [Flavihumibacter sediminis]
MKYFLGLALILVSILPSYAQNRITGKIEDSTAKSPLTGATVQLRNSNFSRNAVTDKTGSFSFTE